jgi:hypothetical protein
VYEKLSCVFNCMYLYVLVCTFLEFLYWYVPVCTGMYRYVLVHTILPDPVQVYRIPDVHTGTYHFQVMNQKYVPGTYF